MATVAELSEPYCNHLIPVLPPDWGFCGVCRTAAHPDFRLCFQCNTARNKFRQGLADVVVPIAPAAKREQLAYELWHYKYDVDPSVRAQLTMRLGAVVQHRPAIVSWLHSLARFDQVRRPKEIGRRTERARKNLASSAKATSWNLGTAGGGPQHPTPTVDENLLWLRVRAPDIQAAMSVLGRRPLSRDDPTIYLSRVDLRSIHLRFSTAPSQGARKQTRPPSGP